MRVLVSSVLAALCSMLFAATSVAADGSADTPASDRALVSVAWMNSFAGDNVADVHAGCASGDVSVSVVNTANGAVLASPRVPVLPDGSAQVPMSLPPGGYTVTVNACGIRDVSTLIVDPVPVSLACSSTDAPAGFTVTCQASSPAVTAEQAVSFVDGAGAVLAQGSPTAQAGVFSGSFVMPDVPVAVSAVVASNGVFFGQSAPVVVHVDADADLALSCTPLHASLGSDVSCQAVSGTGKGAWLRFSQGDWSTTIRTVKDWREHTVAVPIVDASADGQAQVIVTLLSSSRQVLDVDTAMVSVLLGQDLEASPPALSYAFVAVDSLPCPDDWGLSWQEWAGAPVCQREVTFDADLGRYAVSYDEIQGQIARYFARAHDALVPRAATVMVYAGERFAVASTQKVMYSTPTDLGLDARDEDVLEQVIAASANSNDALVFISAFADRLDVRDRRADQVAARLVARGVPADRIRMVPGDVGASSVRDRVDVVVGYPTHTPVVSLSQPG